MFGRITPARGETLWFDHNAKRGVFARTHNQQNAAGTFREHKTSTNRTVYKEEYPDLISAVVRRVSVKEEQAYEDKTKMEKKILVSLRGMDGKDAVIKFSMGSSALQVLGALNAADLTKPITLKNFVFPAGEKTTNKDGVEVVRERDETRLVGYQGDQKLKNVYGPEGTEIPKAQTIVVTNPRTNEVIKEVKDFTDVHEFIVNLANSVAEKAKAAQAHQPAPSAVPAAHAPAPAAESDDVGDLALNADDIVGADDTHADGGDADAAAFAQQQ